MLSEGGFLGKRVGVREGVVIALASVSTSRGIGGAWSKW